MELLEKSKKQTSTPKEYKIITPKNTKKPKNYVWLLGVVLLIIGLAFWAVFSENTPQNRYLFLENKIAQNQELSPIEKSEFCSLFFKIKGISLENCEILDINTLKTYITYKANVGQSVRKDYKITFFEKYPDLKGKVVVHHAVEQQVLKFRSNEFTESEIHSIENLRGISKENYALHLTTIRIEWNKFYKSKPFASKKEILDFATYIDLKYGHLFLPKTPKIE